MADIHQGHSALGDVAARTLANATKTVPQLRLITPRWFTHMLNWVPVEAGIYRVNKVKDPNKITWIVPRERKNANSILLSWITRSGGGSTT